MTERENSNDCEDNRKAFIKLFVPAQPKMFSYIVSLVGTLTEADEIMQETSFLMWSKFDAFARTAKTGEAILQDFVAWGNQIAFYKVLNWRRKKSKGPAFFGETTLQVISDEWGKLEETNALERRRRALKECVGSLSPGHRELLEDYYWHETSVAAIAERSNRTNAGVYKILQRIRSSLHQCINSHLARES